MLLLRLEEGLCALSLTVLSQAFKRIPFLVGYEHKVPMIFVGFLDGFIISNDSHLIAPLPQCEVFANVIKQASTRFSIVKRSKGQSAVEKAFYISRSVLVSEFDGQAYRPKYHDVICCEL